MRNRLMNFKAYLHFLSPQEQISELNSLIDYFIKDNSQNNNVNKKCNLIKELKKLKLDILNKQR